jgi:hypothetical protein
MRFKPLFCLLSGSLLALSLDLTVPACAQQPDPPKLELDTFVHLDVERQPLYDVLKDMLKQANVKDFVLDPFLRKTLITAKMYQPFGRALESVFRASGLPLTYVYEAGVFRVVPKKGETIKEPTAPSSQEFLSKQITLDVTNLPLSAVLKMLSRQSNVTFTVENTDADQFVTLSVKGTGREALETLLAKTNPALTYRVQNNVISIVKKDENTPKDMGTAVEGETGVRTLKPLTLTYASAKTVADELGKMTAFRNSNVEIQPLAQDTVLAVSANPQQFSAIADLVKLLDVKPQTLILKAELIVNIEGADGKKHQFVTVSDGTTFSNKEMTLDLNYNTQATAVASNGDVLQNKGVTFENGDCRLTVTPRLNGDGTVSLTSKGEVGVSWRATDFVTPLRLERKINGADRVKLGDTNPLLSTKTKIKNDKSEYNVDVLLVLTVTSKPERK